MGRPSTNQLNTTDSEGVCMLAKVRICLLILSQEF